MTENDAGHDIIKLHLTRRNGGRFNYFPDKILLRISSNLKINK